MSWMSESTIKAIAFPVYGVTLVMLIGVEALGFVGKGAQRWLDLGTDPPAAVGVHEAGDRADPRPLLRAAARPARSAGGARSGRPRCCSASRAFLILVQPDLGTCIMVAAVRRDGDVPRRPAAVALRRAGRRRSRSPRRSSTRMMHDYQRKRIDDLPRSRKRSARRRLSHHPVEDRDRLGRHLRQGLPARHPEPPRLSARRPHRLRLRDHGRGMGPGRRRVR